MKENIHLIKMNILIPEISEIPKLIMQTWKTKDVPDKWQEGQMSILKLNPDWKYILMTDQDNLEFIREHFPQYLQKYKNFELNIQRVDFIRYAWMYVHGGIYIDLDYQMFKSFDKLLSRLRKLENCQSDFYLPVGGVKSSINAFLISRPKCQFWIELMDLICRDITPWYSNLEPHLNVLYSTGPGVLINAIHYYGHKYKIGFIPNDIFPMCCPCDSKCETSFGRKLQGCSWVNSSGQMLMFCFCNFYYILTLALLIVILITIYFCFCF